MAKLNINSKDILLLLINTKVGDEEFGFIAGRTRVVKLMFLFKNEVLKRFKADSPQLEKLKFDAWDFGPFSKQVYDDIEFLSNIGFINTKPSDEDASIEEAAEYTFWEDGLKDAEQVEEFTQDEFTLTDQGKKFVEQSLMPQLSDGQQQVLAEFKRAFGQVPLYALLEYVYKKYPDYTTESKIKARVLGHA